MTKDASHESRLVLSGWGQGAGCRVQGAGCRVQGAGFRVRVQGSGGGQGAPPPCGGVYVITQPKVVAQLTLLVAIAVLHRSCSVPAEPLKTADPSPRRF